MSTVNPFAKFKPADAAPEAAANPFAKFKPALEPTPVEEAIPVEAQVTDEPSNLSKAASRVGAQWQDSASGVMKMAAMQDAPTPEEHPEWVPPQNSDDISDRMKTHGNRLGRPDEQFDAAAAAAVKGFVDIADQFTEGDIREDMINYSEDQREEAMAILQDPRMAYKGDGVGKYGLEVLEGTAAMAPALIMGMVTKKPKIALAMISGQVGGSAYNDTMEKTSGDHDKSMAAAKFNVLAEVIPESIPVLAALRKSGAGKGVSRLLETTLGDRK